MAAEGRWVELVEDLGGSAEAKRRLALILETLAGQQTVRGAARLLGLGARRFHILRRQFLRESVDRLEPRAPGRPGRELAVADERIAALEAELQRLRIELQAAQIREEIALAMPQVVALFERYALGDVSYRELAEMSSIAEGKVRAILTNPLYNGWIRRHRGFLFQRLHAKVAARLLLWLISTALRASDSQDGHCALPPVQLAGPYERGWNLRAISFLSELPDARL